MEDNAEFPWEICYHVAKKAAERVKPPVFGQELLNSQVRASAEAGNSSALAHWLSKGGAINGADEFGYTALHWAACNGHVRIVKELLDGGANARAVTSQGRTAMEMAESWGQMEGGGVEPEHVQIMGMLEQAKDDDQGMEAEDFDRLVGSEAVDTMANTLQKVRKEVAAEARAKGIELKPEDAALDLLRYAPENPPKAPPSASSQRPVWEVGDGDDPWEDPGRESPDAKGAKEAEWAQMFERTLEEKLDEDRGTWRAYERADNLRKLREKGPKALDIDWEKLLEEDEEEDDIGKEGWDERLKAAMQYTGADRSVEIQEAIDEQDDDDDESA